MEFRRVIAPAGLIILTDSVSRSKEPVLAAAKAQGLSLVKEAENYCPASCAVNAGTGIATHLTLSAGEARSCLRSDGAQAPC